MKELYRPCECRKPHSGMIEQALKEHGFRLKDSVFIGDTTRDFETAFRSMTNPTQ